MMILVEREVFGGSCVVYQVHASFGGMTAMRIPFLSREMMMTPLESIPKHIVMVALLPLFLQAMTSAWAMAKVYPTMDMMILYLP